MLAFLLLLPTMATAARAEGEDRRSDVRGRELLDYQCSSASGEHRLTLFANGTLRLKESVDSRAEPRMTLIELREQEVEDYVQRLRRKVYDRVHRSAEGGPSGEWVEQCRLVVDLDDSPRVEYRFSPIENSSLDLGHALAIAGELLDEARIRSQTDGFPPGYEPRRGDILLRKDGARFIIERYTSDGKGVEIVGLEQPLTLYVEASEVAAEFDRLLERDSR